ncbi:MAG: SDR family NAD(P)-dependent oxidoreductase [Bdellovibrio sp.]
MNKKIATYAGLGLLTYLAYNTIKKNSRYFSFRNKVVLVSGGSRGLGFILARKLAREGAFVSLIDIDEEALQRAQNLIHLENPQTPVNYHVCDVTKRDDVRTAVEKTILQFRGLDVVINNAGTLTMAPVENLTAKDFEDSLNLHFWGPYNMIEETLPHLKTNHSGRIINISSIGGKMAMPHFASYCTGKFALVGYSKTLRAELIKNNIYVTTVFPGVTRTDYIDHAEFKGQYQKEFNWLKKSDSIPFLTINAEKAAEKIIRAAEVGQAELNISMSLKLGLAFQSLFPEIHSDLMALANIMLPPPILNQEKYLGRELRAALPPEARHRNDELNF